MRKYMFLIADFYSSQQKRLKSPQNNHMVQCDPTLTQLTLNFKVARLDFLGGIPLKFKH